MWTVISTLLANNKHASFGYGIFVAAVLFVSLVMTDAPFFGEMRPLMAMEVKPLVAAQKQNTSSIYLIREDMLIQGIWRAEDILLVTPNHPVAKERKRQLELKLKRLREEMK